VTAIKAVIFDFYGTLAETPAWGPSWEELVAELGHELPPEVRDRWWNDGIDGTEHDEHSQSRDHYVAWQQARVRSMLTEAAIPEADQDVLIARVHEISGHRQINAYDETAVVLAGLRDRGLALGICSNWDWDLVEAIEAAGLTDATDVVVSSAWVGARKPHPRIYNHILDEMGIEPESVLFVGDTWACDVEGPTAIGMQAAYIRRPHFGVDTTAPEQLPKSDRIHPVADLTSLPRLCN
jgi:putative hydrolase of the HAD superfamily